MVLMWTLHWPCDSNVKHKRNCIYRIEHGLLPTVLETLAEMSINFVKIPRKDTLGFLTEHVTTKWMAAKNPIYFMTDTPKRRLLVRDHIVIHNQRVRSVVQIP